MRFVVEWPDAPTARDKIEVVKYSPAMLLAYIAMASLQAEAQKHFAEHATNPSAVQYRNVKLTGDTVCGEVNRPNEQGGYDGFRRFTYRDKDNWVLKTTGVDYLLAEGDKFTSTKSLDYESELEEKWDLRKATELLRQANEARDRSAKLLAACN